MRLSVGCAALVEGGTVSRVVGREESKLSEDWPLPDSDYQYVNCPSLLLFDFLKEDKCYEHLERRVQVSFRVCLFWGELFWFGIVVLI